MVATLSSNSWNSSAHAMPIALRTRHFKDIVIRSSGITATSVSSTKAVWTATVGAPPSATQLMEAYSRTN